MKLGRRDAGVTPVSAATLRFCGISLHSGVPTGALNKF
jgi:hypothetical protein